MLVHKRRLSHLQYVLVGLLFGCSVYLWNKSDGNLRSHINSIQQQLLSSGDTEELDDVGETSDTLLPPEALQEEPSLPCEDCTTSTTESEDLPSLQPFPEFKLTDLLGASDANRTLDLLDLAWEQDANCTGYEIRLLKGGSNPEPGALVSFPGSGNSWLRMLLMGVTGVFIQSVYPGEDAEFQSKANSSYQVPLDCGCTLLQKTHDFSLDAALYHLPYTNRTQTLEKFKRKGILIVRNPFTAIRSYRNFNYGGMQGAAPAEAFKGEEWDNFVARSVAEWETLATVWIRGLKRGGVIYYERLRHETRAELTRLIGVLGLKYDERRLDCVLRHAADNSFKRNSNTTATKDPFTASQRMLIHKSVENVQQVLKERGLDPLPIKYYEFFDVLPEYGISESERSPVV